MEGTPAPNGMQEEIRALRSRLERERALTARLLHVASTAPDLHGLLAEATQLLHEWSGCDAVGIRLRDGHDFPYFETRGFPPEFIQLENSLCVRDLDGQLASDHQGNPVLECMCGNVLCRRFDPDLPFFTPRGSFWSNCTTELLASTSEADRLTRTRNRCNGEGYESVALIALTAGGRTLGLLQLNDHRRDRFTVELITLLEDLAAGLAEAVARRQAEESLRRSEVHFKGLYEQVIQAAAQDYRVIADNTYDWEFWRTPDGRFRYVSPSCERISGYAPADFLADPELFLRIIHPSDHAHVTRHLAALDEAPGEIEFRILTADGQVRWIGHACQPVFDANGRYLGKRGSNRDITDRKRSESLLLVERDLALALGEAGDVGQVARLSLEAAIAATGLDGGGVYLVDPDTGRLHLECHAGIPQAFAREVAHYEPDSENGRIVARGKFFAIDDTALGAPAMAFLGRHGMRAIAVVPVLHDGRPIACLNLGSRTAKRIADHERHAMEGIAAQMGMAIVRVRSEQARRKVQEELRAIYDHSPVMMCVLDGQRRLLYLNRTMADFVGTSEEQLKDQRACGVIGCVRALDDPRGCGHGPHCPACPLRQALEDTIATGHSHHGIESRMTLRESAASREVVLLASTASIQTGGGTNVLLCLEDVTQRRQAEEALKESENRYRLLTENVLFPVVVSSLSANVVLFANRAAESYFGVPPDTAVGRQASAFWGNLKARERIVRRVAQGEPVLAEEVQMRTAAGEIRYVLISVTRIEYGGTTAAFSVFSDITDRKRSEELLRDNEAKYRVLFENLTQGVFRQQADGKLIDVNPAALQMLGISRDQFLGRDSLHPAWDLIQEDGTPVAGPEHPSMRAMATGLPVHSAVLGLLNPQTGQRTWMEVNATPEFRPGEQKPYQVLVTLHDITQRRAAQESLRDSERRYRQLFEAESDAIFMVDVESGRFMDANPAAVAMYGYTKAEFLAMSAGDVSAEPVRTRAAIAAGDKFVPLRWHRRKDGSVFPVEISAAYFEHQGRRSHVATIRDNTRRKEAEELLQESAEQYRSLVASTMDAVLLGRPDGQILAANEAACAMFGRSEQELIDVGRQGVTDPADPRLQAFVEERAQAGRIRSELTFVRKDGTRFPGEVSSAIFTDRHGQQRTSTVIHDITERKRIYEALRTSEETYRALVEGLPDVVMRFDRDGRHLFVSRNVEEIVDIPAAIFLGKTHRELRFLDELCAFWEAWIRRVFETGGPFESEFALDGERGRMLFDWRLLPEFDARGDVASVLSIYRDITAHRQVERNYQTLFREMHDGFALHEILCDSAGAPVDYRFLAVNPSFERLTGLRADAIVGNTVREVLPAIEPQWIENYGRVALTGEPLFFEAYSGALGRHFEVKAFQPAPGQFACTFADVTDRKRAEAALRERETLLNNAEAIAGIGSFTWDPTTDTLQWSQGMCALCGLAPERTLGDLQTVVTEIVHRDDLSRVEREISRMIGAGRLWPIEYRIVRPDGATRLIQLTGQFIVDNRGAPTRLMGILFDVTQRRADEDRLATMRSQLNHATRLTTLGELAAGIAHEVNQPLCSIVNFAKACKNMAAAETPDLEQIAQWSDAAALSASRAGDIIRGLTRFARFQPERVGLSVRQLFDDAILLLQHEAKANGVTVRLHLAEPELTLHAQAAPTQQVLVNLLRNGIEALAAVDAPSRLITVQAARYDHFVQFSVSDNAAGLEKPDLTKIFQPFFTTKSDGLGLGLAISRTIVEDHCGSISAKLNADGGLTIQFTLPAGKD